MKRNFGELIELVGRQLVDDDNIPIWEVAKELGEEPERIIDAVDAFKLISAIRAKLQDN